MNWLKTEYKDSFPARFGGVHFVNQPWYIHALYTLIKPFLKDKTRKRIFLHGNNLNSLHQLIHPEFLPSEFGGTLPPYDMGTWARTLLGPDYSDENDYTHTSYNAMHVKHTSSNLERECSPKPMKRSQSVVEAGTLKHEEKGENENTQPLLALDWTPSQPMLPHRVSLQRYQPPRKHMRNWPTQMRAFGLTQDPPLLPPSNDCHAPLAGAATVEQKTWETVFFCFFFQWGNWRRKQGSYVYKILPLPYLWY